MIRGKDVDHKPNMRSRNRQYSSQLEWAHTVARRRRMGNKLHRRQLGQRRYFLTTQRICTCKEMSIFISSEHI